MAKHETRADILREMRGYSDKQERMGFYDLRNLATETLCVFADRLDVAAKREAVTDCNLSNAVKVYDVMTKWRNHLEFKFANGFGIDSAADIGRDMLACLDEIKQSISAPLDTKPTENVNSEKVVYNGAKTREALESIANNLENRLFCRYPCSATDEWMWQKARAALAEPPRNCDLPTVIAKPHGAWLKDCDNWDDFGNPKMEIHEWLLAKAKGDNK